jgi:D-alanyl-D-alanine carboxypeptidase (penicillin-binding protein 5/6)
MLRESFTNAVSDVVVASRSTGVVSLEPVPSSVRRPFIALVLSACTLMATALVAPVGTAAAQGAPCENKTSPPPPVDTSEQVAPGATPPKPLAVPENPVGGERLGECGVVLPANAQALPDDITAESWLLADLDSGSVLAAYDPHGRQRPASVIKVLLATVVAKELPMNATVVANQEDLDQECTCVGLRDGGEYTVDQLLHALVMASGNDVAHALARRLGGLPSALRKMNALAAELGALDTRAITPSGLDGPGTSTSAYDVALIFRAAMKYQDFAAAIATPKLDFPAASGKGTQTVLNDNRLLGNYEGALGGKTGFTDDAQHTYVGSAQRDGRRLVVALLRGQQQPQRITDQAAALLDYGFAMLPAVTSNPVGKLVEGAPQAKKKTNEVKPTETSAVPGQQVNGKQSSNTAMSSAFGNVGLPITAVAALGVLLAFVMVLRSKKAKKARARRNAQQQAAQQQHQVQV